MQSEKRRAYHREYKRRRRADPVIAAKINQTERERMRNNPALREAKNARARQRYATNEERRKLDLKRRAASRKRQQSDDAWREKYRKWQADHYKRHETDHDWRHRRDLHRVKTFYGVDDAELIEALALARAAKRKLRSAK